MESKASAAHVLRLYQTLKDLPNAEIFYVELHGQGTSIVCGARKTAPFVLSLGEMHRVAAWALTYR